MTKHIVKLKIADIIIKMQSRFPLERFTKKEREFFASGRFDNFSYNGERKHDILVDVEVEDKLPKVGNARHIFTTYHFENGKENWRLVKKGNTYIYKCPLKDREQIIRVNNQFDKAKAYLLPHKQKGRVWNVADVIYDFLQVLLINYFALNKLGIFTHAFGIKDLDGEGLLFAGRSGCGKSTSARLWHKYSRAMILNDDRIIVRRSNGRFFIHGSPWHGAFSDYLASRIEAAPLKKSFFIHHSCKNIAREISKKRAFNLLYPAMFPAFWDKGCLENIVSFCEDLVSRVPCYSLGFVNNKRVIGFVRKIE